MPALRGKRWLTRRLPAARHVRLAPRQVFILPTRAGWALAAAVAPMLLVAVNYQNSPAYALTFLLVSLALVSLLHTWRTLLGVELRAGPAESTFAGQAACFQIFLGADSARSAIALGWPGMDRVLVDIPETGEARVELLLPALRRGWLVAPRLRVESRFPLGLWVAWSGVDLQQQALVYPQPTSGSPMRSRAGGGDGDGQPAGEGVDDFRGLRQHQPADGARRLDWKAFSRGQGLRVKEFAAWAGGDWLLDLDSLPGPLEERLSRLCQAVLELCSEGRPFELRVAGKRLGPAIGAAHREACLRALALHGLGEAS